MVFDDGALERHFDEEMARLQREVKKPGILLAGVTGAGKSSLANMVFGKDFFIVGTGRPVTQATKKHETDSIIIYDTKGCEVGGVEEFRRDVLGPAMEGGQVKYNIAWYCIPCPGGRVTDLDRQIIGEITSAGIPTAVVFTKADEASDEDVEAMRRAVPDRVPIFETSKTMEEYNHVVELIQWSSDHLDEQLRVAFNKQQVQDFEAKRKEVRWIIAKSVTRAGIIGASPIPFSDAPLLAANEMALMGRILNVYNMGGLANALKGTGVGGAMSMLGKNTAKQLGKTLTKTLAKQLTKTLATSFVKFIPVVGSVVGASVAASFTWAFGGAVSAAAQGVWKAKLAGKEDEVQRLINGFGGTIETMTQRNIDSGRTSEDTF